jgi:flagellar hook-length control protein FliK
VDAQPAQQIEGPAIDPAAAAEAPVKAATHEAAAPTAPLPAAVPVLTNAVPSASAAVPAEIVIATAPGGDSEAPLLEAEGSSANLGAQRTNGHASQVQDPAPSRETAVEAPKVEPPRETPGARSAQELERAADILRQIRVQITPQLSEARIQLQPIELGRVSIHISLENGRMKTTVRAEKTETLQAIQTHLPELRASLRQHGIDAQEFQLTLGFEDRAPRDGDRPLTQSNTRNAAAETTAVERSPSLHAALVKTGVDFYA